MRDHVADETIDGFRGMIPRMLDWSQGPAA